MGAIEIIKEPGFWIFGVLFGHICFYGWIRFFEWVEIGWADSESGGKRK